MNLLNGKGLKPGGSYVDLHIENHYKLADIIREFGFVNLPSDVMVESGITAYFYPHGLGHHLGLQVHDMGGFMANEQGDTISAPEAHPFLLDFVHKVFNLKAVGHAVQAPEASVGVRRVEGHVAVGQQRLDRARHPIQLSAVSPS